MTSFLFPARRISNKNQNYNKYHSCQSQMADNRRSHIHYAHYYHHSYCADKGFLQFSVSFLAVPGKSASYSAGYHSQGSEKRPCLDRANKKHSKYCKERYGKIK